MADQAIQAINETAAVHAGYVQTNLPIKKSDAETRNVISNTFGQYLKNNLEAIWYAIGLNPNVNIAYQNAMTDPSQCIETKGKKFYQHPGVGNLHPYNENGNPAGGVFTMQTVG